MLLKNSNAVPSPDPSVMVEKLEHYPDVLLDLVVSCAPPQMLIVHVQSYH